MTFAVESPYPPKVCSCFSPCSISCLVSAVCSLAVLLVIPPMPFFVSQQLRQCLFPQVVRYTANRVFPQVG